MIIHTRYRDIPWEEAIKCWSHNEPGDRELWESHRRNRPVSIGVPAIATTARYPFICEGPFFSTTLTPRDPSRIVVCCPHIAVIGD